jgi:hypothetical protein
MLSYRQNLAKINILPGTGLVSYRAFVSKPKSLRAAIRSMDAPRGGQEGNWRGAFIGLGGDWGQYCVPVTGHSFGDCHWVEQCQGVACGSIGDATYWFFTSNGARNVTKINAPHKSVFAFNAKNPSLKDSAIVGQLDFSFLPNLDHIGQLTFFEGYLYVSHFAEYSPLASAIVGDLAAAGKIQEPFLTWARTLCAGGSQVIKVQFDPANGFFGIVDLFKLEWPSTREGSSLGRVEFQAINPWDRKIYSCLSPGKGSPIQQFYIHYLEDDGDGYRRGDLVRNHDGSAKTLDLSWPISDVQGACFSPNGHLYITTNVHPPHPPDEESIWGVYVEDSVQVIFYCSPLKGHEFGYIPVVGHGDELEGICCADCPCPNGLQTQLCAVVLDNQWDGLDNITLFYFGSQSPENV